MEKHLSEQEIYKQKRKVTIVGTIINLVLTIAQYLIGYIGGSSALISDATHTASDYIGDIVVLIGLKLASKPADEDHPYGHGKFETFASLGVAILITIAGIALFYNGLIKLLDIIGGVSFTVGEDYVYVIYVACATIVLKEAMYRYTVHYGKKLNSIALIANAAHHRTDSYSSIGVLIGVICTFYFDLTFMDPLASIFVAGFILYTAWEILRPAFHELVETAPDASVLEQIKKIGDSTKGTSASREIRTRGIGGKLLVDIKIEVDATFTLYEAYSIGENVKKNIKAEMDRVLDVIVHLEPSKETSISSLQKQSKIEAVVQQVLDTYSSTLYGVKDIRYHHINRGINMMLIFFTQKELLAREEKMLIRLIQGVLRESDTDIKHIYIGFQPREFSI